MPTWVPAEIRAVLPAEWELVVIEEETSGAGDGASRVHPAVMAAVPTAEIYFGYGIPAALLEAAPELRWVHSGAAGVAKSLTPAMLPAMLGALGAAADTPPTLVIADVTDCDPSTAKVVESVFEAGAINVIACGSPDASSASWGLRSSRKRRRC